MPRKIWPAFPVGLLLLAGAPTPGIAAESHPFNVHDLVEMARVSDPAVSPDGTSVVFTLRTTDLAADKGRTDLWQMGIDGSGLHRVTESAGADGSAQWAPGGEVYFVSDRSGSSQVWALPVVGGEPRQVTDLPLPVGGFTVSPQDGALVVALAVFPDCADLSCTVERLAATTAGPASGVLYDSLFVRHWDAWADGRRSHLFAIPSEGVPIDLMRGMDADCPSKPFGGMEEVALTPDGQGVVFSARDVGSQEAWSTDFDLFVVPLDGSAEPLELTAANAAWDTQPVFSPDGKWVAYLAMARPRFESDRFRIVLRAWSGSVPVGEPRVLTEGWDRSPAAIAFAADGRSIYATADDDGEVRLFAVSVEDGSVRRLIAGGHVRSAQPAGRGRILFGLDDLHVPVDLYTVALDGSDRRRLTEANAERLAGARRGEAERFEFAGWNGERVAGYVVRPVDFDPTKRYPLAFLIHGGPQGSFGNDFHYRWNVQPYAGAGYAVVTIDFHGSLGYGQGFTDAIRGDWGGKPLEDLQKGLAAALERYPWIDGDRACALGASYGGYMINWIAGNWPDRFRCLVSHDGIFDQRMMYYSTEELWFPEWEHGGPYWLEPAGYERHNPAADVASWKTPMLVVHGENDYRIPVTQGLAAFTALQRQGVPSRLLYFPNENHWVLRPSNSVQWHDAVLDWLDRWTASEEAR
jgi:dipeptidyl aminopeptidase/acylaminoacyl peptidase